MNLSSSKKISLISVFIIFIFAAIVCGLLVSNAALSFADNPSGNLTIKGQSGVSYDGYKVFDANIAYVEKDSKRVEDVTYVDWSSDNMKDVTLNFLRNNGYSNGNDFASDALYFIKTQIESDGITTHSVSDYFSYKFAKELVQNTNINKDISINSGSKTSLDQGYWLFASPANLELDKIATCPIWTSVASGDKQVSEKAGNNIPTLAKGIKTPEDGNVNVLDGRVGNEFEYEISGTLPSNYSSFPTYKYIVTDNYSQYLEPVLNVANQLDYKLKDLEGNDYVPDVLTLDSINNKIEFGFYDLNKVAGITPDTVFVFSYKAKVIPGAVSGPLNNNAILTYTSDPITCALATSVATQISSVNIYTFNLKIHVVDANKEKGTDPGLGLEGAQFGIKIGEEQFIQEDGSVGPESFLFESDANGLISVPALCRGTYTIVQEHVPEGYVSQDNDVVLTINPSFNDYKLIRIACNMEGGYTKPIVGDKWYKNEIINIDLDNGVLDARICNLHQSNVLPITGLAGYAIIALIALAVFAACCFGIYKVKLKTKNINNNK